jgi:hypothetical protein
MQYGYLCPVHGPIESNARADFIYCTKSPCSRGFVEAKRDWRFKVDLSFEAYYAPSFGTVVKSRTHAKDLAKIASEEQTIRQGVEHNFTVVDTHDDAAVGVDTDHKNHIKEMSRKYAIDNAAGSKLAKQKVDVA